jgi:hypothetical protein
VSKPFWLPNVDSRREVAHWLSCQLGRWPKRQPATYSADNWVKARFVIALCHKAAGCECGEDYDEDSCDVCDAFKSSEENT